MPVRVAHYTVSVRRGSKNVDVRAGTAFDFTDAEIRELLAMNDRSLRRATVETPSPPVPVAEVVTADTLEEEIVEDDDADGEVRRVADRKAGIKRGRPARVTTTEEDEEL